MAGTGNEDVQAGIMSIYMEVQVKLIELMKYVLTKYPPNAEYFLDEPEKSFLRQGGTDPLDFIYTFKNNGDPVQGIPRHWHYIGLGLTDIHGYAYLCQKLMDHDPNYEPPVEIYPPSNEGNGFGFELTFRVRCKSDKEWSERPPSWPRRLMQNLAWYVFKSKVRIDNGNHIGWHRPLDGGNCHSTSIKHILMTSDLQLQKSPNLNLEFLQIVGVCEEEFQGARECNSKIILDMMMKREETGGKFLVTDMHRGESIFQLEPKNHERFENEVKTKGSNMVQVINKLKVSHTQPRWFIAVEELQVKKKELIESNGNDAEEKPMLEIAIDRSIILDDTEKNDAKNECPVRAQSRMSTYVASELSPSHNPNFYESTYILLSYESARYLPIMLSGRLAHKRPFFFVSLDGESTVGFIPEDLPNLKNLRYIFVNHDKPFGRTAHCHQIYVAHELRKQMYETIGKDFARNTSKADITLPRNYSWPEFKLHVTILDEI